MFSAGIINRKDTEEILEGKETGAFIVRVSERVWGYTLSYKESSRLKHFLIDASDLGYQFFGADQTIHASLVDLVKYHKVGIISKEICSGAVQHKGYFFLYLLLFL